MTMIQIQDHRRLKLEEEAEVLEVAEDPEEVVEQKLMMEILPLQECWYKYFRNILFLIIIYL